MNNIFAPTARHTSKLDALKRTTSLGGCVSALEPRYIFDAAALASGAGMAADLAAQSEAGMQVAESLNAGGLAPQSYLEQAEMIAAASIEGNAESEKTIVFADAHLGAEALETLENGLVGNATLHLIDTNSDGLSQMAAVLAGYQGIDSVHIVSHGGAGTLALGNADIDFNALTDIQKSALHAMSASLSNAGDILIYGCDFAAGEIGQSAVDTLASFTGADVAASNDATGLDGDWDLEIASGLIESQLAFNSEAQQNFHITLGYSLGTAGSVKDAELWLDGNDYGQTPSSTLNNAEKWKNKGSDASLTATRKDSTDSSVNKTPAEDGKFLSTTERNGQTLLEFDRRSIFVTNMDVHPDVTINGSGNITAVENNELTIVSAYTTPTYGAVWATGTDYKDRLLTVHGGADDWNGLGVGGAGGGQVVSAKATDTPNVSDLYSSNAMNIGVVSYNSVLDSDKNIVKNITTSYDMVDDPNVLHTSDMEYNTSITKDNTSPKKDNLYVGGLRSYQYHRMDGQIAEFMVFREVLNKAEATVVSNYMSAKWGQALVAGADFYDGDGDADDDTDDGSAGTGYDDGVVGILNLDSDSTVTTNTNDGLTISGTVSNTNDSIFMGYKAVSDSVAGATETSNREWFVDARGTTTASLNFNIDSTGLANDKNAVQYRLMKSDGSGGWVDVGATGTKSGSGSDAVISFGDVTLADSGIYRLALDTTAPKAPTLKVTDNVGQVGEAALTDADSADDADTTDDIQTVVHKAHTNDDTPTFEVTLPTTGEQVKVGDKVTVTVMNTTADPATVAFTETITVDDYIADPATDEKPLSKDSNGVVTGTLKFTPTTALDSGKDYSVTAKITDPAGNESTSTSSTFTVDITKPTIDATKVKNTTVDEKKTDATGVTAVTEEFGTDAGVKYTLAGVDAAKFHIFNVQNSFRVEENEHFTQTNSDDKIAIRFDNHPDYETPLGTEDSEGAGVDNTYKVTLVATDKAGNKTEQDITVTVDPVDDNLPVFVAPAFGQAAVDKTDETEAKPAVAPDTSDDSNKDDNTYVYDISGDSLDVLQLNTTDADTGNAAHKTVTYGGLVVHSAKDKGGDDIGNGDKAAFLLDQATGMLSVNADNKAKLNIGDVYELKVRATSSTDSDNFKTPTGSAEAKYTEVTYTIKISGNHAPVFATKIDTAKVAENATATYDFVATDAEDNDTSANVIYTITGEDADDFTITTEVTKGADGKVTAKTGKLTFTAHDYENPTDKDTDPNTNSNTTPDNIYNVTVVATDKDGLTKEHAVAITVTNVGPTADDGTALSLESDTARTDYAAGANDGITKEGKFNVTLNDTNDTWQYSYDSDADGNPIWRDGIYDSGSAGNGHFTVPENKDDNDKLIAYAKDTIQIKVIDDQNTATINESHVFKYASALTVDTTALTPTASLTTDSTNGDGGTDDDFAKDKITNSGALTDIPAATANSVVEYRVTKGDTVLNGTVNDGWVNNATTAYTAPTADGSADGDYTVEIRHTDAAGNSATQTLEYTLDSTKPDAPDVSLENDTTNGGSGFDSDDYSKDVSALDVTAEDGAKIQYNNNNDGKTWEDSYTAPTSDGEYTIQVRQTDKAGNVSAATEFKFELDTQALDHSATPSPTVTGEADDGTITVSEASDGVEVTLANLPTLDAGDSLKVTWGSVTKDVDAATGVANFTAEELTQGESNPLVLEIVDKAGNVQKIELAAALAVEVPAPAVVEETPTVTEEAPAPVADTGTAAAGGSDAVVDNQVQDITGGVIGGAGNVAEVLTQEATTVERAEVVSADSGGVAQRQQGDVVSEIAQDADEITASTQDTRTVEVAEKIASFIEDSVEARTAVINEVQGILQSASVETSFVERDVLSALLRILEEENDRVQSAALDPLSLSEQQIIQVALDTAPQTEEFSAQLLASNGLGGQSSLLAAAAA